MAVTKLLCCSLLLASLMCSASALLVIRLGKCPAISVKKDFDPTRYMGRWWEYQRFSNPFELSAVCATANYTLIPPNKVKVVNSAIQVTKFLWWTLSRKPIQAVGEAVIVNQSEPAILQVSFAGMPAASGKPNYFVVDTDYENFSIVFSCSGDNFGIGNVQFAWILTRQQGVKPANLAAIYKLLTDAGVDTKPFITVDNSGCS